MTSGLGESTSWHKKKFVWNPELSFLFRTGTRNPPVGLRVGTQNALEPTSLVFSWNKVRTGTQKQKFFDVFRTLRTLEETIRRM